MNNSEQPQHPEIETPETKCMLILGVTNSDNLNPSPYYLSPEQGVVIGREFKCQIVINSALYPTVSRHHAEIKLLAGSSQWQICDLKTPNGTYINEKQLEGCQTLQSGDRILLSKEGPEFIFECTSLPVPVQQPPAAPINQPPAEPEPEPVAQNLTPAVPSSALTPPAPEPVAQPISPAHPPTRSLWNLSSDQDIRILSAEIEIRAVAFSPDGKTLASGSADKTIKLWNIDTGEEICTISGHRLAVTALAFSSDGQILATASADKTIKLWNLSTKEEISTFSGLRSTVNSLIFSPDGQTLASGSEDNMIKLWNLGTGSEIRTLAGYAWQVGAVAIRQDGQMFASGSEDKMIKLWQL